MQNSIRYRGYVYDNESGWYYLRSRYYDPEICRFINADTLLAETGDFSGFNLFSYCGCNPLVRKDETGHFWDTVIDVVSLIYSVYDVVNNPNDAMAWVGLSADIISLVIPFATCGGLIVDAISKSDNAIDLVKTYSNASEIRYTTKVLDQINNEKDLYHAFPTIIDTLIDWENAKVLIGDDGIARQLIEMPGSIGKQSGIFEYIIEPNGWCNHRLFKEIK